MIAVPFPRLSYNPLFLVPAKWEELPFPELNKRSLKEAVEYLPYFLNKASAIDDEVIRFTQSGGWQKMNNMLPPLYRSGRWLFGHFYEWISRLSEFTDNLGVSDYPFL